MRTIQFRARNSNDGWVYGNLVKFLELYYIIPESDTDLSAESMATLVKKHLMDFVVDKTTIGQFTGKIDKNKIKVYEDDIVEGKFPYADRCLVVWDVRKCGLYLQPIDRTGTGRAAYSRYYQLGGTAITVLGNLHDNPELEGNPDRFRNGKLVRNK